MGITSGVRSGDRTSVGERLRSPGQFLSVVARERCAADRNKHRFAVVVIDTDGLASDQTQLIVDKLATRVAECDAGWLDKRHVGALLRFSSHAKATGFARDLIGELECPISVTPSYGVHVYPKVSNGRNGCNTNDQERYNGEEAEPGAPSAVPIPAIAPTVSPLFLRPLPAWKRAMDAVGACTALFLFWPIMLFAAISIKLSSRGPVVFKQRRAGIGGKPFGCYKFRTMIDGADSLKEELLDANELSGPVFKIKKDPRTTLVGQLLRVTSTDELPQLWNVLRGEMSLVGPRPPTLAEVLKYEPWQLRRLEVTPGLTCIWQVSGRCEIPFEEWVRMDIRYVENRCLLLDLKILFHTVYAVLSMRGAY
jgi:lipopolysaccharide/colanic/teichoic acid biosynthesis glycosyltransferase